MGKTITVGIQGRGSSTIKDMSIIASLLEKQTGIRVEAVPEDNILQKLEWLKNGRIDALYEGSSLPAYLECKRPEEIERNRGPFQNRIFGSAHTGAFGFMVRGDSPIKTIYDIGPSTRIAMPSQAGDMVYALLAWLKLNQEPTPESTEEAKWNANLISFDSWEASLRSIAEGKADVAGATPENPLVKEAADGAHGIRFLDLPVKDDPEGAERFRQFVPFGKLVPALKQGVKEIWGVTSMVGPACLWCRPNLDSDLAYELTKWFDENYELYKDKGNKLYTYTREALRWTLDVAMAPVHDGAMEYFREVGLWTGADDARQEYNLKLMDWYCETWTQAITQANKKGIVISLANEEWLKLWANCKKEFGIPGYRQMTDEEIKEGLVLLKSLGR